MKKMQREEDEQWSERTPEPATDKGAEFARTTRKEDSNGDSENENCSQGAGGN